MSSSLATWFLDGEDWLIRRILEYAKRQGYARYTSTLEEAWRLSIHELTATLLQALAADQDLTEFEPDESFETDPISSFAVLEAERHRQRGIELKMFLGLFKYYRQTYLDRVEEAGFGPDETHAACHLVTRIFDRLEIAYCSEWANQDADDQLRDLQRRNREITNEKNRFLTVTESLASPVILLDSESSISYLNLAAASILGLPDRPGGFYYHEKRPDLTVPTWLKALVGRAEEQGVEWVGEHSLEIDGTPHALQVHIRPMLDVSDKFQGTVVILHDITILRRTEAELAVRASDLERLSHTDSLTGLLNRRGLHAVGGPTLDQARASSRPLCVLYGDVDDLKAVNDRFGHEVGDQTLQALALALQHSVRNADLVARIGGDEVVVVLPDCDLLEHKLVEERLHDHLKQALGDIDPTLSLTVSFGRADFDPLQHLSLDDLLADADRAMYRAKQDRGGRETLGVDPTNPTPDHE